MLRQNDYSGVPEEILKVLQRRLSGGSRKKSQNINNNIEYLKEKDEYAVGLNSGKSRPRTSEVIIKVFTGQFFDSPYYRLGYMHGLAHFLHDWGQWKNTEDRKIQQIITLLGYVVGLDYRLSEEDSLNVNNIEMMLLKKFPINYKSSTGIPSFNSILEIGKLNKFITGFSLANERAMTELAAEVSSRYSNKKRQRPSNEIRFLQAPQTVVDNIGEGKGASRDVIIIENDIEIIPPAPKKPHTSPAKMSQSGFFSMPMVPSVVRAQEEEIRALSMQNAVLNLRSAATFFSNVASVSSTVEETQQIQAMIGRVRELEKEAQGWCDTLPRQHP